MALKRDLIARIDADADPFERAMRKAQASAAMLNRELAASMKVQQGFQNQLENIARQEARNARDAERRLTQRHDAMTKAGQASLIAGAAMAAGLALSTKAAVEWESAWAGVTKTVDGTAAEMTSLEGDLRELAKTLPSSAVEIAGVAEAAGQLGIKRQGIVEFSKVMIDLGQTTNLTADEAATAVARFANVMGTATSDVDRLGATIVALGNAGASTESDILDMSSRLVGAGKLVGATESDVLALANAMSSMGIEAEAGGGVMSRALIDIYKAVKTGGPALASFAETAGMSGQEFAKAFGDDPIRAVDAFVQGLNRIDASGGNAVAALDRVGIVGSRDQQVFLALKGAGDLLTDSLDLGAEAWKANTALLDEANKRYDTNAAKMAIARNQVTDLAVDVGNVLLPALAQASDAVSNMAGFLNSLPEPVQAVLTVIGVLSATVGLLAGVALMTAPKIAALRASLLALGVSAGGADKAMKGLGLTLKAGAIAGAALGVAAAIGALNTAGKDTPPAMGALSDALADFAKSGAASGALAKVLGADMEHLGEKINNANRNKWTTFTVGRKTIEETRDELHALDQALAGLVTSGNAAEAAKAYGAISAAAKEQGVSVEELAGTFSLYGDALHGVSADAKLAKPAIEGVGGAVALTDEEVKVAAEALKALAEVYAGFVAPLGAYETALAASTDAERKHAEDAAQAQNDGVDAKIKARGRDYEHQLDALRKTKGVSDQAVEALEDKRDRELAALGDTKKGWEDYADAVTVSVDQYLDELEKQVAAQQAWETNMLLLAGKVSAGTLDELEKMGPEGAPLVAELVNASDAELARLETAFTARGAAATTALADTLIKAQPVLATVAATAGQATADALARKLADGTATIEQVMALYGLAIVDGVAVPVQEAAALVEALTLRLEGLDGKKVHVTVRVDEELGTTVQRGDMPGRTTERDGGPAATGKAEDVVRRAGGGMVNGPGTSTSDSVKAYLSDGEYVVNAKATAANRPLLEAINSGAPVSSRPAATAVTPGPSAPSTSTTDRSVHIGQVVAHDYDDFRQQLDRQERLEALGG